MALRSATKAETKQVQRKVINPGVEPAVSPGYIEGPDTPGVVGGSTGSLTSGKWGAERLKLIELQAPGAHPETERMGAGVFLAMPKGPQLFEN